MINIKYFDPILWKIEIKSYKNVDIYNIGYIKIKKKLMIMKISTAYKGTNKYLIFDSTNENKELLKNTMVFGTE